jgi:hypothetical protein
MTTVDFGLYNSSAVMASFGDAEIDQILRTIRCSIISLASKNPPHHLDDWIRLCAAEEPTRGNDERIASVL